MSRLWAQAPAYLSWTDSSGTYRSLGFDVVVDEQWTLGSDITKKPVEVGARITDNIRPRTRRVVLKVTATNEPIQSNQWTDAELASAGAVALTNQRAINVATELGAGAVSITPGDGVIDVPDWDSQLALRVLAGTAAGLLGGAVAGTAGGAIGAVAGSALAGSLLQGRVVDRIIQTDAPSLPPATPPGTITPTVLTFGENDDFVARTIALLEQLNDAGQTIDVWGTKSSCVATGASTAAGSPSGLGGMAIAELTHDRNQGTGTGADITITLEQIRVVYTTTVPAPKPTKPDSAGSVSKGNQGTFDFAADANAPAEEASPFAKGYAAGHAAGEL